MVTRMIPTLKRRSIIVMASNVNLVKGHDCSDSDVLTYVLVKDYSFGGSFIFLYAHICLYVRMEALFNTSWSIP